MRANAAHIALAAPVANPKAITRSRPSTARTAPEQPEHLDPRQSGLQVRVLSLSVCAMRPAGQKKKIEGREPTAVSRRQNAWLAGEPMASKNDLEDRDLLVAPR